MAAPPGPPGPPDDALSDLFDALPPELDGAHGALAPFDALGGGLPSDLAALEELLSLSAGGGAAGGEEAVRANAMVQAREMGRAQSAASQAAVNAVELAAAKVRESGVEAERVRLFEQAQARLVGAVQGNLGGEGGGGGSGGQGGQEVRVARLREYQEQQRKLLKNAQGVERTAMLKDLSVLTQQEQAARGAGNTEVMAQLQEAQCALLAKTQQAQMTYKLQEAQLESVLKAQILRNAGELSAEQAAQLVMRAQAERLMKQRHAQLVAVGGTGGQPALSPGVQPAMSPSAPGVMVIGNAPGRRQSAPPVSPGMQPAMSPSASGVMAIGDARGRRQSAPPVARSEPRASAAEPIAPSPRRGPGGTPGPGPGLPATAASSGTPAPSVASPVRQEPVIEPTAVAHLPTFFELPAVPENADLRSVLQYTTGIIMIGYAWLDKGDGNSVQMAAKVIGLALSACLAATKDKTEVGKDARRIYAVAAVAYGRTCSQLGNVAVGLEWYRRGMLFSEDRPGLRDTAMVEAGWLLLKFRGDHIAAEKFFRNVLERQQQAGTVGDVRADLRADAFFGVSSCFIIRARGQKDPKLWDAACAMLEDVMRFRAKRGHGAGHAFAATALSVALLERRDGNREAHADSALQHLRSVEKVVTATGRASYARWAFNVALAWRAKATWASKPETIANKKTFADLAVRYFSFSLEYYKALGTEKSKECAFVKVRLATALLRVPRKADAEGLNLLKVQMELAVGLLKEALSVLTRAENPVGYAAVIYRLGCALQTRLAGSWEANQEFALRCFEEAKKLQSEVPSVLSGSLQRRARLALRTSTVLLLRKKGNQKKNVGEAIKVLQEVMRDLQKNPRCPEFAHIAQQISIAFSDRLALGGNQLDSDDARCALGANLAALKVLGDSRTPSTMWLGLRAAEAYMETRNGERLNNLRSARALFVDLNANFESFSTGSKILFQCRVQLNLALVIVELASESAPKERFEAYNRVSDLFRSAMTHAKGLDDWGRYSVAASGLLHVLMCLGCHDDAEFAARFVARDLARSRRLQAGQGATLKSPASAVCDNNFEVYDAVMFKLAEKEAPLWEQISWCEEHKLHDRPLSLVPRNSPVSRLSRGEQTRYINAAGRSRYIWYRLRQEAVDGENRVDVRALLRDCVRANEGTVKKIESDALSLLSVSEGEQASEPLPRALRDIEAGYADDTAAVRALRGMLSSVKNDVCLISLFSGSLWRDPRTLTMVPGVRAFAVCDDQIVSHSSDEVVDPVFDIEPPLFMCTRKAVHSPPVAGDASKDASFKFHHEISPTVTEREIEYCSGLATFLTALVRKFDIPLAGKRFVFSPHRGLSRVCFSSLVPSVDSVDGSLSFTFDGTTVAGVEVIEHVMAFWEADKGSKAASTSLLSGDATLCTAGDNDVSDDAARRAVSPVSPERPAVNNSSSAMGADVSIMPGQGNPEVAKVAGVDDHRVRFAAEKETAEDVTKNGPDDDGEGEAANKMATDTTVTASSVEIVDKADTVATGPDAAVSEDDGNGSTGDKGKKLTNAADAEACGTTEGGDVRADTAGASSSDVRIGEKRSEPSGGFGGFGGILGIVKKSKLYEDLKKS